MKKTSILILFSITALVIILMFSCGKQEQIVSPPLPGNEALTTMILRAVNTANPADTPSAQWKQLDPTGATPADTSKATLNLKKNATYNVSIQLLDTLVDLTPEIKTRQNYHLFCFGVSTGLNITCVQTDKDTNPTPLPVGLTDLFTTTGLSNGTLEVTLHHQPNVKNGDCAPGSIDMDCTYVIKIQ